MSSILDTHDRSLAECLDLESLMERCLGRPDFVGRLLNAFNSTVDSELAELERAIGGRDGTVAAKLAHRVRGSSLSVSAVKAAETAYDLEQCALRVAASQAAGATDAWGLLEELVSQLRSECQAIASVTRAMSAANITAEKMMTGTHHG